MVRKKIPSYGRSRDEVLQELALHEYAADVPIGNTDPTVRWGKMYNQNIPNKTRMARGPLRVYRGKYS